MFVRLAAALAARGIASLRIDFAGSGDSEEPDLALDYPGMVLDATASLTYLQQRRRARPEPARGARVCPAAARSPPRVAGTVPGVAALVSWSGAIANGYEEDPDAHEEARENGYVVSRSRGPGLPAVAGLVRHASLDSHPLDDVAGYTGPVLAVVGSDDDVVPPGGLGRLPGDRGQHGQDPAHHRRRRPRLHRRTGVRRRGDRRHHRLVGDQAGAVLGGRAH